MRPRQTAAPHENVLMCEIRIRIRIGIGLGFGGWRLEVEVQTEPPKSKVTFKWDRPKVCCDMWSRSGEFGVFRLDEETLSGGEGSQNTAKQLQKCKMR